MRRGRGIVTPWSLRRAVARAARSHAAGGGRRAAPAVEGDALAQADEPPAVAARPVVAAPVVADHELDGLRLVVDAHDRARGGRVAHDVDERLLDDAKGGGVDAGRQVEGVAAHVELDRQPGRAHALHERPDPLQRGLRRQRELLVAAPQDAEQAAQLPERLSAGLLDRGDGGAGARGVGRHGALGGRGLDEHDRHVVGDDVVQLARDPGALAQDRRRLARGAVALDLARLLVQASVERVARAQHAAGERRDADRHDRHPGDAARHVAGHALEHRGRREHADRGDAADHEIARGRPQTDQEDADHAQEDRDLGGVEQASAYGRLDHEEQVDGEQAGQGRAPREGQRHRGQDREDERDRADAGVLGDRRLGELGEGEEEGERGQHALGLERAPGGVRESPAAHPRGR
jgi:hypothetical protein